MISSFKGLPLVEQKAVTWRLNVAKILAVIELAGLLSMVYWRILSMPEYFDVICLISGGLMLGGISTVAFGIWHEQLYCVPPREQWGEISYWIVDADNRLSEALPGLHLRSKLFSLAKGNEITLHSIARQAWPGCEYETHRLSIEFNCHPTKNTVTDFLNWLDVYGSDGRLLYTDQFDTQLKADAACVNLPFKIEKVPTYKAV